MYKYIIIALTFSSVFTTNKVCGQDAYIGLSYQYIGGFSTGNSFGKFVDSYNAAFEGQLKNKLNNIGIVNGYSLSLEGMFGFYTAVNMIHLSGSSYATFTEGIKRYFKLEQNIWNFPIGFGMFESNSAYVSGGIGIGFNSMVMTSYAEYLDGTQSMGNERILNGSYKSFAILWAPEFQFGKSFGNFAAGISLAYHFNTFSIGNSDYFNLDRNRMSSIPEDYQSYLNDPNFGIVFDEVKFNFHGLMLGISLKYNILGGLNI